MPDNTIGEFRGEYRWLSNFWPARVTLDGVIYPAVENAYQAAKASPDLRAPFMSCTPVEAKRMGHPFNSDQGWHARKVDVMRLLLDEKFAVGTLLAERLMATGDALIVEGNTWGDTFWGVCRGRGENMLGRLLMSRRDVLRGLPEPERALDARQSAQQSAQQSLPLFSPSDPPCEDDVPWK